MVNLIIQNLEIENSTRQDINQLLRFICQLFNLDFNEEYDFLTKNELANLEVVMTDLYIQELLFENHIPRTRLFNALVELISFTIGYTLDGPVCPIHQEILKLADPTDVILSFNYDLLVDNSARVLGLLNDEGYSVDFSMSYQNGEWCAIHPNDSPIKIIKLHGSLNWIQCTSCERLYIYDPGDEIFNRLDFRPLSQVSCPHCRKLEMRRRIIPPIQGKEYDQSPFSHLWRNAAENIQNVKRIVLLGYSLPLTDFAAVALLRRILLTARAEELEFIALNPDSKMAMQIEKIFPQAPPAKVYPTPEIFLREYPRNT